MAGWRDYCGTQTELKSWFLRKVAPAYWWGAAPGITIVFDDFGAARGRLCGWVEPGAPGGYRIHVADHLALPEALFVLLHELAHILRGDVPPGSAEAGANDADDLAGLGSNLPKLVALMGELKAAERADVERACDDFALVEYRCWDAADLL